MPSDASIVSRPPPWSSTDRAASASPSARGAPACHRASVRPKSRAESTPTRVSGTSAASGPRAFLAVAQSCSRPLWLNSHRSWVNGAAADSSGDIPTVAERTAATAHVVAIVGASEANEASVQIGCALR